jgi:fatty-acyl-CoA synthase
VTAVAEPIVPAAARFSPSKAWLRALELTASIGAQPERILPSLIEQRGVLSPNSPALIAAGESFTYTQLVQRSSQYTRWAMREGLGKQDTVGLLMPNRPEYMAAWVGITRAGCTVALLNTNLGGRSMAHCLEASAPRHIIVAPELKDQLASARPYGETHPRAWTVDDPAIDAQSSAPLRRGACPSVTIHDRALLIYTSGTMGLPKAANISHARIMQWSLWFAGLLNAAPGDRMYNCLPMYHSVGGVVATGAMLSSGGCAVIGDRFSASSFWNEIVRWDCTLFQYIGELCRYLLHAPPASAETEHRVRMCCGNGLRGDIWDAFKSRFRIPHIVEFYAATEGNVSFFNVEGKPGSIGRIPAYLKHRFPAESIRLNPETLAPVRDDRGLCVSCEAGETGEAIGRIFDDASNVGNRYEGYTDPQASEAKVLRDVFEPGDAWFRTGDLMRKDEQGYFYFADRTGDTFRWKGENVSTTEVEAACCEFAGVEQAAVYGVSVPAVDGRAGMAAIVVKPDFDLDRFRAHLANRLPVYAQPVFLRIRDDLSATPTFKFTKQELAREGYSLQALADALYVHDREREAYIPVNEDVFSRVQGGEMKL